MISFPIIKKLEKSLERTSKGPRKVKFKAEKLGAKIGYLKTDYVRFSCPAPNRTDLN